MPSLRTILRRWVRRAGFDIVRYTPATNLDLRRQHLLEHHRVSHVLDVGANVGQYAATVRDAGFQGLIVSFEPVPVAFAELEARAARDPRWRTEPWALGAEDGSVTLNVAPKSVVSSPMTATDPYMTSGKLATTSSVEAPLFRLDSVWDELSLPDRGVALKARVPGYEWQVLDGAVPRFAMIDLIELSLSPVPLFAGEQPMSVVVDRLQANGYRLVSIDTLRFDADSLRVLQVNAIFARQTPA